MHFVIAVKVLLILSETLIIVTGMDINILINMLIYVYTTHYKSVVILIIMYSSESHFSAVRTIPLLLWYDGDFQANGVKPNNWAVFMVTGYHFTIFFTFTIAP